MSRTDDGASETHPRQTLELIGHQAAEQALLEAYRGGRFHHAWLLGGPRGIGKATLAYRFARFLLANPDPASAAVCNAVDLAVLPEHPAAHRLAAQAHPDVFVLERSEDAETGKLPSFIPVERVRRIVPFFGATAGEGGWRIAIVDSADELNAFGANALLKLIEEPPKRSVVLLISHAPAQLLPTIRSRCRRLDLKPLESAQVAEVLARLPDMPSQREELIAAAEAGEGSVGKAWRLASGDGLKVRQVTLAMLAQLPASDGFALHDLGDLVAKARDGLNVFRDTVEGYLAERLRDALVGPVRLARISQVWDKVTRSGREVEIYNLERKPFVFLVFSELAEALKA